MTGLQGGHAVASGPIRLSRLPGDQAAIQPTLLGARVLSNENIRADYWSLVLDAPTIAERAQPGQFVMLTVARQSEAVPILPRPMAIFRWDAAAGTIEIVYRLVGDGTRVLATWDPGEVMTVVGPLGRGFQLKPDTSTILLLGRGIGTCSLTALAEVAIARGVSVHAVASGRSRESVFGGGFYREAGARHVLEVVDADGSSDPERLRGNLLEMLDASGADQVFVCGSQRLLALGVELAARYQAEVQVSLEAHMACGLGYCHGCSTGAPGLAKEAPLVCTEGPVFVSTGGGSLS